MRKVCKVRVIIDEDLHGFDAHTHALQQYAREVLDIAAAEMSVKPRSVDDDPHPKPLSLVNRASRRNIWMMSYSRPAVSRFSFRQLILAGLIHGFAVERDSYPSPLNYVNWCGHPRRMSLS